MVDDMYFQMYKLHTERELMAIADSLEISATLTKCRITEGGSYHSHYYEVKVMDGERMVYRVNHGNEDKAWNEIDRLRKHLIIGRQGMLKTDTVKKAITDFESSDRLTGDYIQMFQAITNSVKQGNGLTWKEVEVIVCATLTELYC